VRIKIFFLVTITGGAYLFIPAAWPLISTASKLVLTILVPLPYIFVYLANRTGPDAPHIISAATHVEQASHYPYDRALFHPGVDCRTCGFAKPARSKHCSRCRTCIARADHHCLWVNNCLGRGNYKFFLGLLLSTTAILAFAALLAYLTVAPQVCERLARRPAPSGGGGRWRWVLEWLCYCLDAVGSGLAVGGLARSGVGLLALLTAPLPAGLLVYHLHLIRSGMTTNESSKWSDWRAELSRGTGFIAPIVRGDKGPPSRWPRRSRKMLVLTSDGLPPRHLSPEIRAVVGEHARWRPCSSLKEVDNIYDLGPWRNLLEVLLD
jgi:hypothetical protein